MPNMPKTGLDASALLQALQKLPSAELLWAEAKGNKNFKKNLGQNFIFDENLTAKIAGLAKLAQAQTVLEIGAGAGSLTRAILCELLACSSSANLFVIEPDARCVQSLQPLKEIMGERLQIRQGFFEKLALADFLPHPPSGQTAAVANLPYNVASVILFKLLDNIKFFSGLTLMFQAEVAERICAAPNSKDYGRLSVSVQFLCDVQKLLHLPPQVFSPPPQVDSAVVQLLPYGDNVPRQASWQALQTVTKAAFSTRRKMLRKSLHGLGQELDISAETLLHAADIDGTRRAETLTIEEFDRLAATYETLSEPFKRGTA